MTEDFYPTDRSVSSIKIAVGMSGGVDSSVAAWLLKQRGYDVFGIFMKNWDEDDGTHYCTAQQDFLDAQSVCETLNIPLEVVNFAHDYWEKVFSYFLNELKLGRTPNPDVLCNREIKFETFAHYAEHLGADFIATGHYARKVIDSKGCCLLLKGKDSSKDQSYFLHQLSQKQLSRAIFPLGSLKKIEIRDIAKRLNLVTAAKKDSTGICFIGERHFTEFLSRYLPTQPGSIVDTEGRVIGEHQGLMHYTLGQRQGLGIGGVKHSSGQPWFVLGKDMAQNRLIVVQGEDSALFNSALYLQKMHWIDPDMAANDLHCSVKIRYRQEDQVCHFKNNDSLFKVTFSQPQRSVTPGQFAVFYQGDLCLGGGAISSVPRSYVIPSYPINHQSSPC